MHKGVVYLLSAVSGVAPRLTPLMRRLHFANAVGTFVAIRISLTDDHISLKLLKFVFAQTISRSSLSPLAIVKHASCCRVLLLLCRHFVREPIQSVFDVWSN